MASTFNATTTTGLQLTPDNSGAFAIQTNNGTTALTINTSQQAAFAQSASVTQGTSTANYLSPFTGFRNRIINGGMFVAQRGTSFSSISSNPVYTLDRWGLYYSGTAPATVAQVSGPTGYRNALQITGATGNTLTEIYQRIESYNCSDLSGQTITIQANIATSSSQTVYWGLSYATAQDNYTSQTTITTGTWSATSTATVFTATITGLPSGVTNGLSLVIAPQNNGAFTSGTITITGVQLEVGSVATPFEVRSVGTELALCQRYYQSYVFSATGTLNFYAYGQGYILSTLNFPPMRVTPTVSYIGTWTTSNVLSWIFSPIGPQTISQGIQIASLGNGYVFSPANGGYTLSAEL